MGGSVYYDPVDIVGSQLKPGIVIAIRLGRVTANVIDSRQTTYRDIPDQAKFGYLKIESINDSSIAFSYRIYDRSGAELQYSTAVLKLNEQIDIDNDSVCDLLYEPPQRARTGMESAVYLTFVSSQEALTTSMFAIIPRQYSRGLYPNGVIGINPDGRFILCDVNVDGAMRSLPKQVENGDFILDTPSSSYRRIVRSDSLRGLSEGDFKLITDQADMEWTFTAASFQGEQSAILLFRALPATITCFITMPTSEEEAIAALNKVLSSRNLVREISLLQKVPIPQDDLATLLTDIETYSDAEIVMLNRLFLQHVFPDICPKVDETVIDIADVLPLASVIIGEPDAEGSIYSSSRALTPTSSKALTPSAYDSQRKVIEDRYSAFSTLKEFPIECTGGDTRFKITNSGLKIGLRGTFDITWTSVSSTIEGAVFLQVDTNITANASFNMDLIKPWSAESTTPVFAIGPIILNVGGKVSLSAPLNVSANASQSFGARLAFTGLYGAGIDVGANWGISSKKWWFISIPCPYFNPYADGRLISETAYYVGTDSTWNTALSGINISINPNISWGLTANISSVIRGSIMAGIGMTPQLTITNSPSNLIVGTASVDLTTSLTASAGVGVTIPIVNLKVGKDWDFPLASNSTRLATWEVFRTQL
jgi:hypothetical protein